MAIAQRNLKPVFANRSAITSCLIQGLLQLILALIASKIIDGQIILRIRNYDETFNWAETIAFITYKTYFRDDSLETPEPGWSLKTPATSRTQYWMMYYAAICTVWVITSLFLLAFAPGYKNMSNLGRFYRKCWLIVMAIVAFSDAYVSVQYFLDLEDTFNEEDYYTFIGFTPNNTSNTLLPTCMKTAYKYIPPILMSLFFSRGLIGWILTVTILVSATEHFHKPKPAPIIEKPEEKSKNLNDTSTQNEDIIVSSTTTSNEILATNNPSEQGYIPWTNVLYVPYEENTKAAEYYDEHYYENVTDPQDILGDITIEIPPRIKPNPNSSSMDESDHKNADSKLKIDVGHIRMRINRNEPVPPYQNVKFLKTP